MGTTAGDSIDIGIGVHETPGSSAVVDRLRGKLAEFRAEVAKPIQNAVAASVAELFTESATSVGQFTLTIEKSREIMAAVGGDFDKFRAEILKLKTAHDEAAAAALTHAKAETTLATVPPPRPVPPVVAPVAAAAINSFDQERAALQENLDLELDLIREAAAKRIVSREAAEQKETQLVATFARQRAEIKVRETAIPTDTPATFEAERRALAARFDLERAAVKEGIAKRVQTERQGHDEIMRLLEQFAGDEVALRQKFGTLAPVPRPTAGTVQLGPQLPPNLTPAFAPNLVPNLDASKRSADQLATEINVAIGAYQRMAQQVNVTDATAVAAFRREGDALALYLVKLGATDAELNVIANTITRLERRAGGAPPPTIQPVAPGTITSYDRLGGRLRTAANATAILSQSAVTGTGSLAGMAAAAGNVALGIGAFATGGVAIGVAAIGALVTALVAGVGLMQRLREESIKTKPEVLKLFEGAKTNRLEEDLDKTEKRLAAAQATLARLQREAPAAPPTFGPGGGAAVPVTARSVAIEQAKADVLALQRQANTISGVLQKRADDTKKEIEATQTQLAGDAIRIQAERVRGEFAARRVAIDQEFAREKKRLEESGADQAKVGAAMTALEAKQTQDLITLEKDRTDKLTELRRQAAGQLLVARTDELQGEVAAQKAAIAEQLADKIAAINLEVGLESVRGVRIAAARADALKQLRKIETDQARAAIDLEHELDRNIADAQLHGQSDLERAIDAANQKRLERQRDINKISIGDAEATANERRILEVQADEERDSSIVAARRTHGEELKKIADETENAVLELTGKASQARRNIINAEIDERIKAARKARAPEATFEGLERERTVRIGLVGVEELQTQGVRALDELDAKLKETQALAVSGAISEREARSRVIDAYTKTRDALAAVVPELLRLAIASDNTEAIKNAQDLNNKFLELENTLNHVRDGFGRLKTTARESTTDALAGIFEGATKLGAQDTSQIAALREQLQGARDELNALLGTPSDKRTSGQNQRITALRGEIEQTTVSLNSARDSITTWKDLFINAAQAIVEALIRVSSQMLATAIIERSLAFLGGLGGGGGGGGGGSLGPRPEGGGATGGFGFGFAEGGPVRGPGTSTSDSILARLSNREFVQPARATAFYGEDWMEAQRRLLLPRELTRALLRGLVPITLRPRTSVTRFADGGLVSAASMTGMRLGGAGETHHVKIIAPPGFQLENINSPEGARVIVQLVSERPNAFNAALGRR